jgi:hypothetical protein
MIFNYRHYIELSLKSLLLRTKLYFEEPLNLKDKKNHDISCYLKELVSILNRYNVEFLVPVSLCEAIFKIYEMDPKNDKFRYEFNRTGELQHSYTHNTINLLDFTSVMEKIHDYLDFFTLWYDEDSELPFTDFNFVVFVQKIMSIKDANQLTTNGKLGRLEHKVSSEYLKEYKSVTYLIDNSSIKRDKINNNVFANILRKHTLDDTENSFIFANIKFFSLNSKLWQFSITIPEFK